MRSATIGQLGRRPSERLEHAHKITDIFLHRKEGGELASLHRVAPPGYERDAKLAARISGALADGNGSRLTAEERQIAEDLMPTYAKVAGMFGSDRFASEDTAKLVHNVAAGAVLEAIAHPVLADRQRVLGRVEALVERMTPAYRTLRYAQNVPVADIAQAARLAFQSGRVEVDLATAAVAIAALKA